MKKKVMYFSVIFLLSVINILTYGQTTVSAISAKGFYHTLNDYTFEMIDNNNWEKHQTNIEQVLISVELTKTQSNTAPSNILKFTVLRDGKIIMQKQKKVQFTFYNDKDVTLFLLNDISYGTGTILKAELLDKGKVISTMIKTILVSEGD